MKYLLIIFCLLFSVPVQASDQRVMGIQPFPPTAEGDVLTDYKLLIPAYTQSVDDVLKAGARGLFQMHQWREGEPKVGKYDQQKISGDFSINRLQDFDQVLLGIQVINTVKREVPASLRKASWDSVEMVTAFKNYIDWLAPQMEGKVAMISIGNEVDVYLSENPDEWDSYKSFYDQAVAHIHQVLPGVLVGTTTTFGGLKKHSEKIRTLNQNSDVMIMTYYHGIEESGSVKSAPSKDLPAMMALVPDKKLVLQEAGYATAASLGGSEDGQVQFVHDMFEAWEQAGDAVPFISFFMQHDFAPDTCRTLSGYYGGGKSGVIYDFLCSLGFRDAYGKPKKAWNVLIERAAGLP